MEVEHGGERYYARTTTSPNKRYTVAYQDGQAGDGDPQPGRVFLFEEGNQCFTAEIDHPNACAVANDGTVSVVDWNLDWGDELSGTFHVFTPSGQRRIKHEFEANLGPGAITPDGSYAATSTYNPDCSTYVFDIEAGELLLHHENEHGNIQHLDFAERADQLMLRLGELDGESAYGIDLGGHITWKSEVLQRQERFERLFGRSKDADPDEAIDLLEEASALATADYEKRNVDQLLADTHWTMSRSIEQEDGETDDWWKHLDLAAKYYDQIIPRYAGKKGLAKVRRRQGKQHLDDGNEDAARECFEEIADLEEEYDVQLLTAADERRLDRLR